MEGLESILNGGLLRSDAWDTYIDAFGVVQSGNSGGLFFVRRTLLEEGLDIGGDFFKTIEVYREGSSNLWSWGDTFHRYLQQLDMENVACQLLWNEGLANSYEVDLIGGLDIEF